MAERRIVVDARNEEALEQFFLEGGQMKWHRSRRLAVVYDLRRTAGGDDIADFEQLIVDKLSVD